MLNINAAQIKGAAFFFGSYIRVDTMCFCPMPSESFRKTERTA